MNYVCGVCGGYFSLLSTGFSVSRTSRELVRKCVTRADNRDRFERATHTAHRMAQSTHETVISGTRALSVDDTHNANGRATETKLKRCLASECVVCLCYCLLNCLCSAVVGLDAHSHSRARTHTHTMRRIPAMERAPVAFQRAEWNVTGGTKSKG